MVHLYLFVQWKPRIHSSTTGADVHVVPHASKHNGTDSTAVYVPIPHIMNHPCVLHSRAYGAFAWSADIYCMSGHLI